MANVSLKTDFKDGEKLFGQQLNNNFSVIKAALEAMNKIVWQDDPDDSISAFRGTTEEINQRDIIDGQLLYDTTTGETYIDVGSQRISTGSGNAIHIGSDTPTNPSTQIWIDPNEPLQLIGTEVVNSMEDTESNKAPSVQAVKNYIDNIYSTDEVKTNKIWINNEPIYRKVVDLGFLGTQTQISYGNQIDTITSFGGYVYQDNGANMSLIEYTSSLWRAITYTVTSQHTMNVVINRSDESAWSDWKLKIVIEYTKVNDSVGGE